MTDAEAVRATRQAALRAGCPATVSGLTAKHFCSSSPQALAQAAQGLIEVANYHSGDVESTSCTQQKFTTHMLSEGLLTHNNPVICWPMLEAAENVATRCSVVKLGGAIGASSLFEALRA